LIWRCIFDVPRDGAANMAIDHALLEGVQAGGRPVLRLYRWQPACLSLGRNQPAKLLTEEARAATAGVDIVRRPTGGLSVWHDRELTYAVAAPVALIGRPRMAYAMINRALAAGLARLGVSAAIAKAGAAPAVPVAAATHPCFSAAAPGEVVAAGRKLVGSAMRIEKAALLQHGSILLDGDQTEVAARLADAAQSPSPITLREAIGRVPEPAELHAALLDGFSEVLEISMEVGQPTEPECARMIELDAHYRSHAWTWRS
jgi:lipoate-protein ligase A